jgi:putative transposase
MSKLIRYFGPGQCVFVTVVTANRQHLLVEHVRLLGCAVARAKSKSNFQIMGWVVLPDHFHVIIHSLHGNVSKILQQVKLSFALQMQKESELKYRVWQKRFWDHVIRSHEDFRRHLDYIHFNPVKHGLTNSPNAWPYSSFHRYVRCGSHEIGWSEKEIESEIMVAGE